jgi:protein-tyrosine phosphatase
VHVGRTRQEGAGLAQQIEIVHATIVARVALAPASAQRIGGGMSRIVACAERAAACTIGIVSTRVDPFRVVFVCTGNICRSPMAEVVFRWFADQSGLGERVVSASAGTGDWHVGERADGRTLDALAGRGYDGSRHRARQFTQADFDRHDLIVALDRSHERILAGWSRTPADTDKLALLLSFDPAAGGNLDVPDPYYAGPAMFDEVLGMIESASRALFRQLEPAIRPA